MYYNARYYDPEIGQFISPDTLVPDPTSVFDYNRYLYARGNPMRYTDPTGHCATTGNGSPNLVSDANCWEAAEEYRLTFGIAGYENIDQWNQYFGSTMSEENLRAGLYAHWAPQYQAWGIHHAVYNPPPTWNEPINPQVWSSTMAMVQKACNTWDCPAIGLDLASLGSSIAQTSAVACSATGVGASICAPAAGYFTYVDFGLNIASVGYEGTKYIQDSSTTFDLSVTLADGGVKPIAEALGAGVSATPGIGIAYDTFMLGYDILVDPFVTTPGQAKVAK